MTTTTDTNIENNQVLLLQVDQSLAQTDSTKVSKDLFALLVSQYKEIVEKTPEIETTSEEKGDKKPAKAYSQPSKAEIQQKLTEQIEKASKFTETIKPVLAQIKSSAHYQVFKTLVGEILDEQDAAREAKNEHIYTRTLHNVSDTIRSIIK